MNVDWLLAGGCVRKLVMGLVSFEGFGLAPSFRRAAQQGTVEIEEWSEHTLICALQAATAGVPFMPTRAGPRGPTCSALHPDRTWEAVDERSGRPTSRAPRSRPTSPSSTCTRRTCSATRASTRSSCGSTTSS